jgi:creatinine amidohydrolase/Fe(II)-dependent formamide hydrolase-like protein
MSLELIKLTSVQLDALPREKTVFFYPVGPVEDHGPQLPMGLDLEEADRLCHLSAQHLEMELPGWVGIVMPRAPLGIDSNTTRIAVTVRAHVLRDWLVDSCESLIRLGFYHFACFTGQLGPRQLTAIEEAGWLIAQKKGSVFARGLLKSGPRPTLISVNSGLLSPSEWLRSPIWSDPIEHGGERDVSVALAIFPKNIDPTIIQLPAIDRESSFIKRTWNRSRGKMCSYWGNPALATAERGSRYLLETVDQAFPKMRAVWEGSRPQFIFKSWYSLVPFNKSFFKSWILIFLFGFLILGWYLMGSLKFDG